MPNHYGRVPRVDLGHWSLTVGGATATGEPTVFTWEDIEAFPRTEVRADHHCVSKRSVAGLTWGGVPASMIVALVPPAIDAAHVSVYAKYGYSATIRVSDLEHPDALLATHLDSQPLSPEHGWPLRLILPHLYGWKGPKWLVAMDYSIRPEPGFWEQRGYHGVGEVWREERYAHQG